MKVHSLSLCARLTLDLHNLNNEGTDGNQQQTRMVHILDANHQRQVVNAISGDMFKHILVEHLTPLLVQAKAPVSGPARRLNPDRILVDADFLKRVDKLGQAAILDDMLTNCSVTDLAGALYAKKAVARKSCAEFGWVVGMPDVTVTQQYFHVKYDPESRGDSAGGESVAGTQAIFHRPASSGVYALVCHLDLYRVGLNDMTRRYVIDKSQRLARCRSLVAALATSLTHLSGAQRSTQHPHLLSADGVIAVSPSPVPAPALSPIKDDYVVQMGELAKSLSELSAGQITTEPVASLADMVKRLVAISKTMELVDDFAAA